MSSESESWSRYRDCISVLDPKRIESPSMGGGIPDVNYVEGWIENKHVFDWPKRPSKQNPLLHVQIKHYTGDQRRWAIKRSRAGGKIFFMLHASVPDEWLLLEGADAARCVGSLTIVGLRKIALYNCIGTPSAPKLLYILNPTLCRHLQNV